MKTEGQVCDRCGKIVRQNWHAESTDMVECKSSFLYFGDILDGEPSRPSKNFTHLPLDTPSHYCPGCLVEEIREWVDTLLPKPVSKGVEERTLVRKEQ